MRGRFWCTFRFRCGQNISVMEVYCILEVWVKRGFDCTCECLITHGFLLVDLGDLWEKIFVDLVDF